MEENNKISDIKPDLSKLSQSVDIKQKSPDNMPQKVILTEDVLLDNPEIIINKSNKKLIWSIFAILMSVIIAGTLLLFVFPKPTSPMDIAIDLQANYELIEFDEHPEKKENVMPGDSLKIKFVIKSIDIEGSTAEVFIRVKFYSTIGENYYANMFSINSTNPEWTNNWIEGADGYYYLKSTLLANQSVEVTDSIKVSTKIDNSFQGKQVTMHMMVECLQAGEGGFQAIESTWETAPTSWKESFRNNWG